MDVEIMKCGFSEECQRCNGHGIKRQLTKVIRKRQLGFLGNVVRKESFN